MDWETQWGRLKTDWVQMVIISGMKPSWRPVTNCPRAILGQIMFNTSINDLMIGQRVSWLHQIVRSGWYSRGLCCRTEESLQTEIWADRNLMEYKKGKLLCMYMQSLHVRKKNPRPCSWKTARGCPAGRRLCGEGPGGPAGDQIEYEPAVCPCH